MYNSLVQLLWQLWFSFIWLIKNNRERKRKRDNKKIMWVWERKLSKSCSKMVVHISFLIVILLYYVWLLVLVWDFGVCSFSRSNVSSSILSDANLSEWVSLSSSTKKCCIMFFFLQLKYISHLYCCKIVHCLKNDMRLGLTIWIIRGFPCHSWNKTCLKQNLYEMFCSTPSKIDSFQ